MESPTRWKAPRFPRALMESLPRLGPDVAPAPGDEVMEVRRLDLRREEGGFYDFFKAFWLGSL